MSHADYHFYVKGEINKHNSDASLCTGKLGIAFLGFACLQNSYWTVIKTIQMQNFQMLK